MIGLQLNKNEIIINTQTKSAKKAKKYQNEDMELI